MMSPTTLRKSPVLAPCSRTSATLSPLNVWGACELVIPSDFPMQRLRPLHLRSEPVAPTLRITTSPRPAVGPAPQQPNPHRSQATVALSACSQNVLVITRMLQDHRPCLNSQRSRRRIAIVQWGRRSLRRSIPDSKQTRGRGSSGGSGRATV